MSCKGEGRKQKGSTQEKGGDSLRCYKNKKSCLTPVKGKGENQRKESRLAGVTKANKKRGIKGYLCERGGQNQTNKKEEGLLV